MVKLRLTRTGRKNLATFRIVATDSHSKRDSKVLELLGHYLPHTKEIEINAERVKYWLSVGAQPSSTVASLLIKQKLLPKSAAKRRKFQDKPGRKATERAEKRVAKTEEEAKPAEQPSSSEASAKVETPQVAEAATQEVTPAVDAKEEETAKESDAKE